LSGDIDPDQMASEAWARLEAFVARRGGTLILSSGPRAWPAAVLGVEAVRKLMPVLDPKAVTIDPRAVDPAHSSLASGRGHRAAAAAVESWPMLQLGASPELSRAVWAGLPRLPWALAGRAKPGATTLAGIEGSGPTRGAVIAAQAYGLGKVLWSEPMPPGAGGSASAIRFTTASGVMSVRWAAAGRLPPATTRFGSAGPFPARRG